jgi:ParB/RepB/Spo0J family partition protein
MADEQQKTGAQKRQVKFSGLIRSGVLTPLSTADDKTYVTEVSDENNELPPEEITLRSVDSATTSRRQKIPLNLIDDSPYQPRDLYDPSEIDNLAHSLAAGGLDEQINVRLKPNGRYELIKGHRRTRAARSLGWTDIDADIVTKTDREAKLSAMISNEGRIDLTDFERGKLYIEGKESSFAKTQDEIAHLFGTTQVLVSIRMAMLELPATIVQMLEHNPKMFGATTAQDIRRLLKEYPGEGLIIEKAVQRINDGANENSVKAWVQQMLKPKTTPDEASITDKAGRTIFKAKFSGREFTIQIKDEQVDAKEIEELVMKALRERAEMPSIL